MTATADAIVWFTRDLRTADHPALAAACRRGAVHAVYIDDDAIWGDWPPGAAARVWLHHSLKALAQSLAGLGIPLHLTSGPCAETLARLAARIGADEIHVTLGSEPGLRAMQDAAASRLSRDGIALIRHRGRLLHDPQSLRNASGTPWRVFTPFWKALRAQLEAAPPQPSPSPRPVRPLVAAAPDVERLGLLPRRDWHRGFGAERDAGEHGAHRRLQDFIDEALARYAAERDFPARDACSRLSPHLAFGELSPAQVWDAVQRRAAAEPALQASAWKFLSELAWREFAHHLLWHFPHSCDAPLDPRFSRFPWRDPATDAQASNDLAAWQRGATGIALVDAGMRELWATGRMHNRVRMVVASLLTKNLRMHWLHGARWFWDTLVDADLANNTLGWQWCAGCGADAAPFFRVFNPDTQAAKFDPDGRYRKRWLDGRPATPIVDLRSSRQQALAAWQAMRARSERGE